MGKRDRRNSHRGLPKISRVSFGFSFPDTTKDFTFVVDPHGSLGGASEPKELPAWTLLTHSQCSRCTLPKSCQHCPAAQKFCTLLSRLETCSAADKVILTRQAGSEKHSITTDLQHALSFVFPALVARSDCPHASLLHVVDAYSKPFPKLLDLTFYAVAFELVGRWANAGLGRPSCGDSMARRINDLESVFHGLMGRLKSAGSGDAAVQGILIDLQWSYVPLYSQEMWLQSIGRMFLEDAAPVSAPRRT